jgi:hypothetical protein
MFTEAFFTKCENPNRTPDYISESGSKYYYTKEGVIRESNHWGSDISTCRWFLDFNNLIYFEKKVSRHNIEVIIKCYKLEVVSGFCKWSDFKEII